MITHLIFAGLAVVLTVFNYYAGRKIVLYPPFIFSLIYLVVLGLYMLPLVQVDPLGIKTLAIVVAGVTAFSAGGASMRLGRYPRRIVNSPSGKPFYKKAIFFFCLALLPAFFFEIQRLGIGVGGESVMVRARAAIIDSVLNGEKPFSSPLITAIYVIAPMLSIFNAFIVLIESRDWRKDKWWIGGTILLALIFSILTTGRTWLLELGAGLAGILLLKYQRFSAKEAWKFVRWPLVAVLVLFAVLVPLNKDISGEEGGTTQAVVKYVFGYAVIPLAGFDYVVQHAADYRDEPNHTFRQILPMFAGVGGFHFRPSPPFDEFIFVPLPTNVYTIFKYYFVDFGTFGMLIAMFVLGAAHTWLFRKALAGSHFFVFLFALSLFPLMMVAFDDQYSWMVNHLQAIAFAVIYFGVLRRAYRGNRVPYVPSKDDGGRLLDASGPAAAPTS
jgi:oligosaccharide repeat unit polymerase